VKHHPLAGLKVAQKPDDVTIREDQVAEVQHEDLSDRLCIDQLTQLTDVPGFEPTANGQDDGSARRAPNSQHDVESVQLPIHQKDRTVVPSKGLRAAEEPAVAAFRAPNTRIPSLGVGGVHYFTSGDISPPHLCETPMFSKALVWSASCLTRTP
jgi:hypothetical protein